MILFIGSILICAGVLLFAWGAFLLNDEDDDYEL